MSALAGCYSACAMKLARQFNAMSAEEIADLSPSDFELFKYLREGLDRVAPQPPLFVVANHGGYTFGAEGAKL